MRWLDPKLDVVFKLLFAHEKNRDILIALLTAVLKPSGLTQRFLYYWARLHASQLSRGDHYEKLCPTLSVLILARPLLPLAKAHSKFRVLEVETHHELSRDLELHFVELSKIELEPDESALRLWMRFLLARDEKELRELAMSDPNIRRATEALAALSQDPEAQELARQREMAQINWKIMRQFEREAGEATGRAEGEAKGRAESLRLAVEAICDVLGIEVDAARATIVQGLDVDGLNRLLQDIRLNRRWP